MKTQNRRRFRSHFINHELRLRLVVDDMVFALFASIAAIAILYYLSNREIGDTMYSAHLSIKETRELLNKGVWVAGGVTFAAVLIFGFWSMLDAHRIAGPAHRLKRLLDEIAAGNLTHEIRFRKNDEFHELAEATNGLVESYSGRVKTLKAIAASIETAANSLPPPQQAEVLTLTENLMRELAYFRLTEDLQ